MRAHDHAIPDSERHVVAICQTVADTTIAHSLLALFQLLQEHEVARHCEHSTERKKDETHDTEAHAHARTNMRMSRQRQGAASLCPQRPHPQQRDEIEKKARVSAQRVVEWRRRAPSPDAGGGCTAAVGPPGSRTPRCWRPPRVLRLVPVHTCHVSTARHA